MMYHLYIHNMCREVVLPDENDTSTAALEACIEAYFVMQRAITRADFSVTFYDAEEQADLPLNLALDIVSTYLDVALAECERTIH